MAAKYLLKWWTELEIELLGQRKYMWIIVCLFIFALYNQTFDLSYTFSSSMCEYCSVTHSPYQEFVLNFFILMWKSLSYFDFDFLE